MSFHFHAVMQRFPYYTPPLPTYNVATMTIATTNGACVPTLIWYVRHGHTVYSRRVPAERLPWPWYLHEMTPQERNAWLRQHYLPYIRPMWDARPFRASIRATLHAVFSNYLYPDACRPDDIPVDRYGEPVDRATWRRLWSRARYLANMHKYNRLQIPREFRNTIKKLLGLPVGFRLEIVLRNSIEPIIVRTNIDPHTCHVGEFWLYSHVDPTTREQLHTVITACALEGV